MAEEITIYECPQCYSIIPYIRCPHYCPGDDNEEESFCEEQGFLEGFLEQMKNMRVTVDEAPDPKILELVPNKERQHYPGPKSGNMEKIKYITLRKMGRRCWMMLKSSEYMRSLQDSASRWSKLLQKPKKCMVHSPDNKSCI